MALNQQDINVGAAPNDGQGDPIRSAFIKCNDNFTQLYSLPNPTPPSTLIGQAGDMPGMYAYDDTYFYYCYLPFDGVSVIWGQLAQSDVPTGSISNGRSNVVIAFANADVTIGVNGTSNVAVFSTLGLAVRGNLTANIATIPTITSTTITANTVNSLSVTSGNITIANDAITSLGNTLSITPSGNALVNINSNVNVQNAIVVGGNVTAGGKRIILSSNETNNTSASNSGLQISTNNYGSFVFVSAQNRWYSDIGIGSGANIQGANVIAGNFIGATAEISLINSDECESINFVGNAGNLYNIPAGNIVGNVSGSTNAEYANLADYALNVIGANQPNIATLGTLSSLSVSGQSTLANLRVGNIGGANQIGAINMYASYQVNSPLIGNALTTTFQGQIGADSNNQPNITALGNIPNLFIGNMLASNDVTVLGNLYAANLVGNITASIQFAKWVTENAQPNITGVGNLNNLTVVNAIGANAVYANIIGVSPSANTGFPTTIFQGNIAYNSNNQPNIRTVGNLTNLRVRGDTYLANVTVSGNSITGGNSLGGASVLNLTDNVIVTGNLQVLGTTTTINSNTLSTNDLFINVANNAATAAQANGGGFGVGSIASEYAYWQYEYTGNNWMSSSNIIPVGNAVLSLGNTTNQWQSLWVSNLLAGGSIETSSLTATGNIRGDYLIANSGIVSGGANGAINIGTSTSWFGTVYATAIQAQYADLAENYLADAQYVPGTVVSFGGSKEVTVSNNDMDVLVAGVVSTNPAYTMNSTLDGNYATPIALMGRVPCRVTGTVTRGAMMVSAGDGTARAEKNPVMGSVIGKALESFDGDSGVIEIVVGKQ